MIRLTHELPASLVDLDPPRQPLRARARCCPSRRACPRHRSARCRSSHGLTLAQYLAQWPDLDGRPGNEVLIFDQFEEVFTADPTDLAAKVEFFAELGVALRDRRLWALFSMREDFLAELDPYARSSRPGSRTATGSTCSPWTPRSTR